MQSRIILFMLLAGGSLSGLTAQEMTRTVVGSAGTYFSDVNAGNLHWTVGEVAVSHLQNGHVISEGFHQTYTDLVITALWEAPELNLSLDVFPNPTAGRLTVQGDWENGDHVRIMDLQGRPLIQKELRPEREVFYLDGYPTGTYLLAVLRNGRPLKTFRVIKK